MLDIITKAATQGGNIARDLQMHIAGTAVKDKGAGGRDIATEGDFKSQEAIQTTLRDAFPTIPFVGEEDASSPGFAEKVAAPNKFVADPIDGTSNYSHGSEWWGTTVAYIENNEPVAGVMYLPRKNILITAAKGEGCFVNGTRVGAPAKVPKPDLSDSIVGMEWGFWLDDARFAVQNKLARQARGSHALLTSVGGLTEVTADTTDAYINLHAPDKGACIWDVAAGVLAYAEKMGAADLRQVAAMPNGKALRWDQKHMEAIISHPVLLPAILEFTKNL